MSGNWREEARKRDFSTTKAVSAAKVFWGSSDHTTAIKMFSDRTNWKLSKNRLTETLELVRASDRSVTDLTTSNPTRIGLQYDASAILRSLASPKSLDYDPQPRGLAEARAAVVAYYKADHGVKVDPESLILTTSTSEGFSAALQSGRRVADSDSELSAVRISGRFAGRKASSVSVDLRSRLAR